MRSLRRCLAACLVLAAPLALGCSDLWGPSRYDALRGAWALRTVGDSTVPFFRPGADSNVMIRVLADTLVFDGRGHVAWISLIQEERRTNGAPVTRAVSDYSYAVTGAAVEFVYVCPPDALCVRPPYGRWTIDGRLELNMVFFFPSPIPPPVATFLRVH